ncbi:MAG: NAD(P) transhydrogenase subunit alpha [Bdellovibrionales bacterium]
MEPSILQDQLNQLADNMQAMTDATRLIAQQALTSVGQVAGQDFFVTGLTVFLLACFVGYYVVWRVTPALHSPLMAVTNAISSVIIVGAIIAVGPAVDSTSKWLGFVATILAGINIFGGFVVTQRMLAMFKKKGEQK